MSSINSQLPSFPREHFAQLTETLSNYSEQVKEGAREVKNAAQNMACSFSQRLEKASPAEFAITTIAGAVTAFTLTTIFMYMTSEEATPNTPNTNPPTQQPTLMPMALPNTTQPVFSPILAPTFMPNTSAPMLCPTALPNTSAPVLSPIFAPTSQPTTPQPVLSPIFAPTFMPNTPSPVLSPIFAPTSQPTTPQPVLSPTSTPTPLPTTPAPVLSPTSAPIPLPTEQPVAVPSMAPTTSPDSFLEVTMPLEDPRIAICENIPNELMGYDGLGGQFLQKITAAHVLEKIVPLCQSVMEQIHPLTILESDLQKNFGFNNRVFLALHLLTNAKAEVACPAFKNIFDTQVHDKKDRQTYPMSKLFKSFTGSTAHGKVSSQSKMSQVIENIYTSAVRDCPEKYGLSKKEEGIYAPALAMLSAISAKFF